MQCDPLTLGQTGQTTVLPARGLKGALPLGSYSFNIVNITDRRDYLHQGLQPINDVPGLRGKRAQKLRKLVAARILTPPTTAGQEMETQLERDLETNVPVLKTSVAVATAGAYGRTIDAGSFDLRVERLDEEDFRTETNLGAVAGLDPTAVHKAVERGLLGIAGVNQRIEYMKRYQAVTGFRAEEIPMFEES